MKSKRNRKLNRKIKRKRNTRKMKGGKGSTGNQQDIEDLLTAVTSVMNIDLKDIVKRRYRTRDLVDHQYPLYHNNTAIMIAIVHRNELSYEKVELLLSIKPRPRLDIRNNYGCTPLMLAVQKGDIRIVNLLLRHNKTVIDTYDIYYKTPLIYAINENYTYIVIILLENDADPNIQDNQGATALMYTIDVLIYAIQYKHLNTDYENLVGVYEDIMIRLIEKGGNLDIQDNGGITARMRIHTRKNELRGLLH